MSIKDGIMALALVALGWGICSLTHCGSTKSQTTERIVTKVEHDTTYTTIHDTTFIETTRRIVRNDTVMLARVDTTYVRDSVRVEVPIEEKTFTGENYSILTEGFQVRLKAVDIDYPTITKTVTNTITKQKRWSGNIGLQAGYGITAHGWSPYAGIGVGIGYNF